MSQRQKLVVFTLVEIILGWLTKKGVEEYENINSMLNHFVFDQMLHPSCSKVDGFAAEHFQCNCSVWLKSEAVSDSRSEGGRAQVFRPRQVVEQQRSGSVHGRRPLRRQLLRGALRRHLKDCQGGWTGEMLKDKSTLGLFLDCAY